ncbi:hypothetical protein [Amycolatopsis taiwanensis]|uniref:hypothetical protein n=1 Tax=Amycolatopsis taiwanensis TaxID=342230 RepID=UPI0004873B10|nr:hypothetical protein [Amycolatopsis taiwanensis]
MGADPADFPQPGEDRPGAPPALKRTPRDPARVSSVDTAPDTAPVAAAVSHTAAPAGFVARLLRSPGVLAGVVLAAAAAGVGLAGRRER